MTIVVAWVLDDHRDVGPGFPAAERTVRSEGCGGLSVEVPDSKELLRPAFVMTPRTRGAVLLVTSCQVDLIDQEDGVRTFLPLASLLQG